MTLDEIRELIRLVTETGVAELEVARGENRVRIRQSFGTDTNVFLPSAAPSAPLNAPSAISLGATVGGHESKSEPVPLKSGSNVVHVKSPIVGTFYESPSPGSPAFIRIGEHVTAGKVLCIIESMKLMNEIEADVTGVVESRLVQDGQPVEYGEALFAIRPV